MEPQVLQIRQQAGALTKKMNHARESLADQFQRAYTEQDFKYKIAYYEKFYGTSRAPFIEGALHKMFKAFGIKCEEKKEPEYYKTLFSEMHLTTDTDQLYDSLIRGIYECYEDFPKPSDYIERVVNRCSSSEDGWDQDTLRLRILKQFIKYGNYLKDFKYGGRITIQKYVANKTGIETDHLTKDKILEEVDDKIFDLLNRKTKPDYLLKETTKKNGEEKEADNTINPESVKKTTSFVGLLQLVNRLANNDFANEEQQKRELFFFAIVFHMKYYIGNTEPEDMTEEKQQEYIDKNISNQLFRDYYSNNLLRYICKVYDEYDANRGNIPSGRGINPKSYEDVVFLYFLFNDKMNGKMMTAEDKLKGASEMLKRLESAYKANGNPQQHHDTLYYGNRINGEKSILLQNPSDFEKIVLNDYVCKKSDEKTAEQNSAFKQYEMVLDEIAEIIKWEDKKSKKGRACASDESSEEQETAAKHLEQIVSDYYDPGKNTNRDPHLPLSISFGLWLEDVSFYGLAKKAKSKDDYDQFQARISERQEKLEIQDSDKFRKFLYLLSKMNQFVAVSMNGAKTKGVESQEVASVSKQIPEALKVEESNKINRSDLLVAIYYLYCLKREGFLSEEEETRFHGDVREMIERKNLQETYDDFSNIANKYLQEANYQKIDGRNLFDLLLILSAYSRGLV